MAKIMKKVDAVVIGFGWTGSIMAKELTEAGLNVVALERGSPRDTYPDGAYPQVIDELTYNTRKKLFQDLSKGTVTFRHNASQVAVPYRQLAVFLPGNGVGGAGLHWSGVHFRVDPIELRLRSHYQERYGKNFIPQGMTIQNFGVSYQELEPFFDKAEKVFGTSGTAWSIKGHIVGKDKGGNPFAPDRSDKFPLPAQKRTRSAQMFYDAAQAVGYHPYDMPSANTSGPYTNTYGCQMGPCNFCGFCSGYVCYMYSKASPNLNIWPVLRQEPKFELRTHAYVVKINLSGDRKVATGVTYVDAQGNQVEQPANIVIVSAFQFHNVHLMLLSGIGKPYDPVTRDGVIGRNFAYQNYTVIRAFFDRQTYTNPFIGAGGAGVAVDDFNADNFDHAPYGFVGGSPLWVNQAGTKPISDLPAMPGVPAWGSRWKTAIAGMYTHHLLMGAHGAHPSYRVNYMDLDPNYRNIHGQPLLRMTFDWQENDIKLSQFMFDKLGKIARGMRPKSLTGKPKMPGEHFNTTVYQTSHLNGGVIMGEDPKTSALNRYLQSWDVHNVFVPGSSAFPQGLGYNPTGLVAALTYWSAQAIRERYLKNPGPLVQA